MKEFNRDIIFNKVRNVKSPTQAYTSPAGTDLYIPEYSEELRKDILSCNPNKEHYDIMVPPEQDKMIITIKPGGRINIPSGIRVSICDERTCLLVANKSGVSSKKGLDHLAELIDCDYHGEIHINLVNTGTDPVTICTGDKIIQLMHLPIIYSKYVEVSEEDFYKLASPSNRGSSGFGSSG